MEEKRTIFSYIGQALATYGAIVVIFIVFSLILDEDTGEFSTLFELFGDNYEKSLSINLSVSIEFFQPRKTRIMLCTMNEEQRKNGADSEETYDYSYVDATARIALYDDMKSAPRITEIGPAPTAEFIARKPGFSSAIEPMKKYIRGVGSGLPIVQDYLDNSEGTIVMEDNLTTGSVITITLESKYSHKEERKVTSQPVPLNIPLSDREKLFLTILMREGDLGITDIGKIAETASSTTFNTLKKLEEAGLVQKIGKKRSLTPLGESVASSL